MVEWKGGKKRKQKEKGEEKEWGKNINVISQKKSPNLLSFNGIRIILGEEK